MTTATAEAETIPQAEGDAAPVVAEVQPAGDEFDNCDAEGLEWALEERGLGWEDATGEPGRYDTATPEDLAKVRAFLRGKPSEEKPAPAPDGPHGPDATTWAAIQAARIEEREAELNVADLSESLKSAKKHLDGASERLGRLIDEVDSPSLFSGHAPGTNGDGKPEGGTVEAIFDHFGGRDAVAQDQAAFDAATLGQLGLSGKLKDNLESEGITSGKTLREWLDQAPRRKLPGIGEDPDKGGLRKIIEASEEFYLKRQRERDGYKPPKLQDGRNSLVGDAAEFAEAIVGFDEGDETTGPIITVDPAKLRDPDAVPLAEAMAPTVRDEKGKPKRFRGNKKGNKKRKR